LSCTMGVSLLFRALNGLMLVVKSIVSIIVRHIVGLLSS
jgi:hypothetical protein